MKTITAQTLRVLVGLCLACSSAFGGDVSYYGIVKLQQFSQTTAGAPVALASNGYGFAAFAVASTNSAVTNATVKPPNTTPAQTLLPDAAGASLRYDFLTNTSAQLDALFPSATLLNPNPYTLTLQTVHDGTCSVQLSFTLAFGIPLSYPPMIQVTNFTESQAVDHTLDFRLGWTAAGASSLDIVQLLVLDASSNVVFASPTPLTPGALSGSSNSVTIPAYALPPGTNLEAHLTIARPGLPTTNACGGAIGLPAFARDTTFALRTRPAPAPPRLEVLSAHAMPFQLRLQGDSNRTYQIQGTADFLGWTNLITTNSSSGTFDFADQQSTNLSRRLYRAKVGQ